jgi:N utilization substance protein A
MNGTELLRVVEMIHRDKSIEKEVVFEGIEQAIVSAARKHFGEESAVDVNINRDSGDVSALVDGDSLNSDEIGDLLGRIAAQTAKQVLIQKVREAERDNLFDEYTDIRSQIVTGTVSRVEGGSVTVNLGKVEGFLPRSEQIPGESCRVGERVRSIVLDVRKAGSRVKIILSRSHTDLVRRLFELEIPEIADHVIQIRSIAREAGYRSKVAVSCDDSKVDAVGACVGIRGSRIKNIINELGGEERIDIVRWNDSLHVLVPNALQPAEVEDVVLCPMLGKVIVLVQEDNLSLGIGRKGQNVRLASKLVGWDINIMTQERLDEQIDDTIQAFSKIPQVSEELAENLVVQGFFTFDDLSVIEPDQLQEISGLSDEDCEAIVEFADREALRVEQEERQLARLKREQAALERAAADAGASMDRTEERKEVQPEGQAEEQPELEGAKLVGAVEGSAIGEEPVTDAVATDDGLTEEEEAAMKATENESPDETGESQEDAAHTLDVAEEAAEQGGFSTPGTQKPRRPSYESPADRHTPSEDEAPTGEHAADNTPAEVKTFLDEATEAVPGGEPGVEVESSEQIEEAIIEPHNPPVTGTEDAEAGAIVSGTQPDIRRSQGGT